MKLLVDHGAFANFGDIAMLEGVCLNLIRVLPQAEIFVIDRPKVDTNIWRYPGIHRQSDYLVEPLWNDLCRHRRYIWRFDTYWRAFSKMTLHLLGDLATAESSRLCLEGVDGFSGLTLREFCANFDGLHMVGGGNLTDTFFEYFFPRWCLISSFVKQGKPVVLTGQQIGPFRSNTSRRGFLRALRGASFVGLREPIDSLQFCSEGGLQPERVKVMGDDSFGLPAATQQESVALLNKYGLTPHKFLAVNFRMAPYAEELGTHLAVVADIISQIALLKEMPMVLVPITFDPADDSDIVSWRELAQAACFRDIEVVMIEPTDLNASLVKGVLGHAFGAIGVSYHFCTFALTQGVPAVCLYDGDYYSQKGRGLCGFWEDNRLALPLNGLSAGAAIRHIIQLFDDHDLRDKLRRVSDEAVERWQNIFDHQVRKAFVYHETDSRENASVK